MARLATSSPSGSTILVVDDQRDALGATCVLLEREGHRALPCSTGSEALATLTAHDVQLVLVDYYMPTMTGAELIKAIRTRDRYVQIVLQTGYAGPKPPRTLLAELDIQGYHNKTEGPDALLMWVDVGLKTHALIQGLRERERLQAELVANVSHEFRTPLNIIGGYAEMLLDESAPALPEIARAISHTNRSLVELVDNFLQYSRVDAGVVESCPVENRTRELIEELASLGRTLVKPPEVHFEAIVEEAGECFPSCFTADAVKLRTILRNLVGNAAKFTDRGQITLRMAATGEALVFQVKDTGPGIAPDKLLEVFEPFRQLDVATTRNRGGVGLGLALSYRLAALLGGGLALESEIGVGSTFTLTIPRRERVGDPIEDRATLSVRDEAA